MDMGAGAKARHEKGQWVTAYEARFCGVSWMCERASRWRGKLPDSKLRKHQEKIRNTQILLGLNILENYPHAALCTAVISSGGGRSDNI